MGFDPVVVIHSFHVIRYLQNSVPKFHERTHTGEKPNKGGLCGEGVVIFYYLLNYMLDIL